MTLLTGQSGIPAGFEQDYNYINSKVNALNKSGAEGRNNWTYDDVSKAFSDAGWTPQQHYEIAGKNEGLSWPSASPVQTRSVTLPGMSNTNIPGRVDALGQSIPNYFDAYNQSKELPGKIDTWMKDQINAQRFTGDQASDILTQIGNQRAGSGIMGGTEYDNSVAAMNANLVKLLNENKLNISNTGNQLKFNATNALPTMAMSGVNALTSLYGSNAADQQNWAQLAAQMINSSY